jgi:hypothetical protein
MFAERGLHEDFEIMSDGFSGIHRLLELEHPGVKRPGGAQRVEDVHRHLTVKFTGSKLTGIVRVEENHFAADGFARRHFFAGAVKGRVDSGVNHHFASEQNQAEARRQTEAGGCSATE